MHWKGAESSERHVREFELLTVNDEAVRTENGGDAMKQSPPFH